MDPSQIHVIMTDGSPLLRWAEVIGIWFTGVATFSAVAVAWSLRRLWERRQRPVLSVGYDARSEEDSRYVPPPFAAGPPSSKNPGEPGREELWVRLHVKNTSKTTARDVQLRILSIQRERKEAPDNRSKWWFKASNLDATSVTIHPQFTQHFDIAYVKNILGTSDDLAFYLVIVRPDLLPWPQQKARIEEDAENNWLEVGWKYTLQLALLSDNADAKYYEMEVKVDPRGSEDPSTDQRLGADNLRKRVHVISLKESSKQ